MSFQQKGGKLTIDLNEDDHLLTAKEMGSVIKPILEGVRRIKNDAASGTKSAHDRLDEVDKTLGFVGPLIDERIQNKSDRSELKSLAAQLDELVQWKEEQDESTLPGDVAELNSRIEQAQRRITELGDRIKANKPGAKGDRGRRGPIPDHEWDGTKIRFENPDNTWGDWVDLRGIPGHTPISREEAFGSLSGVAQVRQGTGVTVVSDGNGGVIVSATGGTGVTVVTPPEIPDSVRTTFTFATQPQWIVADGTTYYLGAGFSYAGTTATLDVPPSEYIRGIL